MGHHKPRVEEYIVEFKNLSEQIMKINRGKFYSVDLLALSVANRSISILNAFETLVKENNWLSAVSLIRLQIDNALRFYASSLVANRDDFMLNFISKEKISNLKDRNGKNLTDSYLVKTLNKHIDGVQDLYDNACSYIHLSDRHLLSSVERNSFGPNKFKMVVGSGDNFSESQKKGFTQAMMKSTKIAFWVLETWKDEKAKLIRFYLLIICRNGNQLR